MRRVTFAAAILLFPAIALTQTRYGSPADLKGAKTFYVDAGEYVKTRNDLVERIEQKTSLTIVDSAGDADVLIAWSWRGDKCAKAVVARATDKDVRVVWNWQDCGAGWTSPQFLFVRKFANLIEDNR